MNAAISLHLSADGRYFGRLPVRVLCGDDGGAVLCRAICLSGNQGPVAGGNAEEAGDQLRGVCLISHSFAPLAVFLCVLCGLRFLIDQAKSKLFTAKDAKKTAKAQSNGSLKSLSSPPILGRIPPMSTHSLSRRSFLALSAMLPLSLRAFAATSVPVGLELYSVRNALKRRSPWAQCSNVAQMGYQGVEFYAPYFDWTEPQTRRDEEDCWMISASAVTPLTTAVRISPRRISRRRGT